MTDTPKVDESRLLTQSKSQRQKVEETRCSELSKHLSHAVAWSNSETFCMRLYS